MVKRAHWVAVLAAALVLTACQPNRFVTGWVPYWNATKSTATLGNTDVASLYSETSLMWFGTAADGSVPLMASSGSLASTVAAARAAHLPVIPTIFDSSAPGVMKAVLADTARRTAHADAIVARVLAGGYDGIDIDYEVFAFGDKMPRYDAVHSANWVSFIRTLGAKLHANGKLLSVTVPAVWNYGTSGYTFYAQDQLGAIVDRLRLMVYDWSVGSPGPIAPSYWVSNPNGVINYTANIARVPAHKVQLGVPAYGRHWNVKANATETCPTGALAKPDSITLRETSALAAAHRVTPTRHSSGELTFGWNESVTGPTNVPPDYVPITSTMDRIEAGISRTGLMPAVRLGRERIVTCTVRHVVFVPDATSIRNSANAALAAGWSGIALWAIGYETADVYQALGGVAPQRANGAPTVTLESATYRTPTASLAGAITVAGLAWNPEFDLPVPVRVQITRGATVVATRTVLANASRSTPALDAVAGIGPFHGLATTIGGTQPAGTYRVCITQLAWGGAATAAAACTDLVIA